MIHLWLSEKSTQTYSFKNVCKIKHHPGLKYQEKQRNADVLLQNLIYYRVFRAWLRYSKKVKAFRKKIQLKLLGSTVDAWFAQSRVNAVYRRKGRAIRDQSHLRVMIRTFRALKIYTNSRKRDQRLTACLKKRTAMFTMRMTFGSWFNQFAAIDKKRMLKYQSGNFKKMLYTRKFLAIWRKAFDRILRKRLLNERKKAF